MRLFSGLLFIVNFAASIHAEQIKLTLKHSMPELNLENLASLEHYGKRGALDEGLVNYGTNMQLKSSF